MAKKCDICGTKIEDLFLGKFKGTYIKNNGKQKIVCFDCQKKLKPKEALLEKLG